MSLKIESGLPTQIRQLEKRLKEMDASKVKPALVKEITDTIQNLKNMLKEKQEKREERKKLKEQKAAETPKEEVKVEAVVETNAASSRCAICGANFNSYAEYVDHKNHEHDVRKEYVPMDHSKKKEVVKNVERELGPAIISEKEAAPKFKLDDVVMPVRGEESTGKVMRWDGKDSDLVYVAWDSGPLADRDGFGGYYPSDLKLHVEEQPVEAAAPVCQDCIKTKEVHGDLRSNYAELLKDLKDEHKEALDKHDHVWVARLDQKIKELEEKIAEKFPKEAEKVCPTCGQAHKPDSFFGDNVVELPPTVKESGAQNAEHLTVMDHIPPRANKTMDEGGKDGNSEYQDMWAQPDGRDLESAKGAPGSLFNVETAPAVAARLNSEIKAPYVNAKVSSLGGPEHVGIYVTISADPKESWANGILHNSRYGMFAINNDGTVEQHSGAFNRIDESKTVLRKRNVKSVDQLIQVLNSLLDQVNATHMAPKTSSLKKSTIAVSVFNKEWSATPTNKEGKLSYDISDNTGKKVLSISPVNGQEMNAEHLKWATERELTKGYKKAQLIERIAMLPEGTKVYVLAQDKAKKRVKIACMEQGVRAWVSEAKIKLIALESQAVQHNGHSDKVLGQTATETLLDCVEGGPVWVSSTELMDANRPPATPEALNDVEALKTALPPVIPDQDAYLNNPVEKKADQYIDSDELSLYTENERDLHDAFMANVEIIKEMLQDGTYDYKQALTYWLEWYKQGAAKYEREFLGSIISEESMWEAAKAQESYMKTVIESGEYGTVEPLAKNPMDVSKLPVMDVEQEKDTLLNQLAKETDPEKKKSLERRYKHLTMASLNKRARVVEHKDGWHVLSEKGKNLGGPYKTKSEAVKRLRQVEHFKNASLKPFSKKAEVLADPYQSLTNHITDMKSRMSQVQERIQSNPVPKTAGETDNSIIDLPELLEDLTMGIDLLETKLGGEDIDPELHANIEELENLLWTVEEQVGITPKLSEEEKAEPEHKEIVEKVEKQAAGMSVTSPASPALPGSSATPGASVKKDDVKPECALCGGMTFNDYAAYQTHMGYTHASNTMPTSPTQKLEPTKVTSNKTADVMTDETITTNDPNAIIDPAIPAAPAIQNVRPTDDDNLTIPVAAPTSLLPTGQKWVFDTENNVYVAMPDQEHPGKTI